MTTIQIMANNPPPNIIGYSMTNVEYLSISALMTITILFLMFIFGASRRMMFVIFVNSLVGMLIYFVLIEMCIIDTTRLEALGVGSIGTLELISIFITRVS